MGNYNVQEKVLNQNKSNSNQDVGTIQLKQNNMADIIQMAKINPKMLTQNDAMNLQRKIGNGGVSQLLKDERKMQNETVQENDEKLEGDGFLQMKKNNTIQKVEMPENKTGMPDQLKAGVENLSGLDMSDVRVNYNSDKPEKVGALAYTQGTDIHVGPGQERHLAHEAWHVVQQKQGRVQATTQMKGVQVNDNIGLEYEADDMGKKAVKHSTAIMIQSKRACPDINTLQMYRVKMSNKKLIATADRPPVPGTVGFITALADQVLKKPYSQQERELVKLYQKKEQIADVLSHTYRSTNGAAFCHKMSINEIEKTIVDYANYGVQNKANHVLMLNLIEALTTGYPTITMIASNHLDTLNKNPTDENAANSIIELINMSPANYYVGHAPTNSSIQDSFDPHMDVDAPGLIAPMSPITQEIEDCGQAIGAAGVHIFKGKQTDGEFVKTSSVGATPSDGLGWAAYK